MSLLAVVGWDPVLTGYLAVLLSVVILCGSVYLLLATNIGVRLGFLVAWTGFWGWNLLMLYKFLHWNDGLQLKSASAKIAKI